MLEILTRYWWAAVLRGVVAVAFGVMAVAWPEITLRVLVLLFGAFVLVDGLIAVVTAASGAGLVRHRGWLVVEGVAGIVVGVLTFLWPDITTLALLYLIAAWALVTGALEIVAAVRLRREIRREWLLALNGVLSVLFGVLLVAWPTTGALAVTLVIGVYAIVFGIVLIWLGLRLRRLHEATATLDATRPAPA